MPNKNHPPKFNHNFTPWAFKAQSRRAVSRSVPSLPNFHRERANRDWVNERQHTVHRSVDKGAELHTHSTKWIAVCCASRSEWCAFSHPLSSPDEHNDNVRIAAVGWKTIFPAAQRAFSRRAMPEPSVCSLCVTLDCREVIFKRNSNRIRESTTTVIVSNNAPANHSWIVIAICYLRAIRE